MSNQQRTWLTLSILSLTLWVLAFQWAGREGLLWSASLSLSVIFLIYFYSDTLIAEQLQGKSLEGQDPWELNALNQKFSKAAFIRTPQIVLLSCETPQALVSGRNRNSGTIYITTSLVKVLTRQEREALMAYLITCLSQNMTFSYVFLNSFISFILMISKAGDAFFRWLLGSRKSLKPSVQNHICTLALSPALSFAVRLLNPASSYYRADQIATKLTGDKDTLAQVLWKLQSYNATRPMPPSLSLSHMFIVNPLTNTIWSRYFHPHPSAAHRIRQLTGQYPI